MVKVFSHRLHLMGLLTSMSFHVLIQARAAHIGFPMLLALKKPLSSMYCLVKDADAAVFKTLSIFLALTGSFSNLNSAK